MLLFIDSFDHYATADLNKKYPTVNASGSMTVTTGGRTNKCVSMTNAGTSPYLAQGFTARNNFGIGFAFYTSTGWTGTNTQILSFFDNANAQIDVRLGSSNTLLVTRNGTTLGTSSSTLTTSTWNYIEFKAVIHGSTGSYTLRVNEAVWLTGSGVNTSGSGTTNVNTVRVGSTQAVGTTLNLRYCDLVIWDNSGSTNNDFLGDVSIACLYPSGAGASSDWTPTSGSNYQCVDENPNDGDTSYVTSGTSGQKDLYDFDNLSGSPTAILGVQRVLTLRKDDAGTRSIKPLYKGSGSDVEGSAYSPGTSYSCAVDVLETNPDSGVAWTSSDVNSAQFGTKLES